MALLFISYAVAMGVGTFIENGKTINKIKLMPRRKNDPCFRGDIYK
jgi:hypothetical protein